MRIAFHLHDLCIYEMRKTISLLLSKLDIACFLYRLDSLYISIRYNTLQFGCIVNLGMPFLPIFLRFDPLLQDILCLGTKVSSRSLLKFCNSHKKKLYHGIWLIWTACINSKNEFKLLQKINRKSQL